MTPTRAPLKPKTGSGSPVEFFNAIGGLQSFAAVRIEGRFERGRPNRASGSKSTGCTHLRNDRQAGVYMVRDAVPALRLIVYERVSTARQGGSGLGLK